MKTTTYKSLNIVIACDKLNDLCDIQKSIFENNFNHRITCVYSNAQLMDYLLKKGSYSGCPEPLPNGIVLNFNESAGDVLSTVTQIRYFEELRTIPVYIACKNLSPAEKQKALAVGVENVYDIMNGYEKLNAMINTGAGNVAA